MVETTWEHNLQWAVTLALMSEIAGHNVNKRALVIQKDEVQKTMFVDEEIIIVVKTHHCHCS